MATKRVGSISHEGLSVMSLGGQGRTRGGQSKPLNGVQALSGGM